ncbi:DUF2243 domain-containing protein [Planomicrobium sp. CPCC 101110]|uniref:DUF2243 domain-containing protein n=1 Tax=Planomicrobium sp. CPCC 101110 TaxID=2599619 RepID=UPI0011B52EB8|nr:DUF2243 domain-containing protein [Planomicrobium sp. CPCC 101110]TWT27420.1 DUF2243 domain-containing protein [Planomicrobium sp. CPCC 101110]
MAITNGGSVDHATAKNRVVYSSFNLWSGFLFGLGFAAFVDESVFHQLLHWHHFYDKSTTDVGLVSDGIFHAFSWFATVGSLFMYANLRRRKGLWPKRWIGGAFLGAGSFQLYDGLIQHKVMKLHQIRYEVDLFMYDVVWNASALILMAVGVILVLQTRRTSTKAKAER